MSDLKFVSLGGAGEVGMNLNVYEYKEKYLIVDCGTGFAGEDMPGITMTVPDISYIKMRREDVVGIFLTHAHEDHCGAIQYLWKDLLCPVYGAKLSMNFLNVKLIEFGVRDKFELIEVEAGSKVEIGPFNIELISMAHSIPEMSAIALHTDFGTVVHSGDWKFDEDPVLGYKTDEEKLARIGDQGVVSLVCDSTNVFSEGYSESESSLYNPMLEIFEEAKGTIAASLFSSNIARISTLCKIAEHTGRKVSIFGRSLQRSIDVAQESGYLEEYEFVDPLKIESIPRNKLLLLCTGCQGDLLAAVSRLAQNSHSLFKLEEGDTVMFSSKIIPGNEKRIFNMLNLFAKQNIHVITEKTNKVHVSGHPYKEELKKLYQLLRPKHLIPVHGEHMHMKEHLKLAKASGVQNATLAPNGTVISISDTEVKNVGQIRTGVFGVDGGVLHPKGSYIIKTRQKLQEAGMIIAILIISKDLRLLKHPRILAPGLIANKKILIGISINIENAIAKFYVENRYIDISTLTNIAKKEIIRKIAFTKKRPLIEIQVEQL